MPKSKGFVVLIIVFISSQLQFEILTQRENKVKSNFMTCHFLFEITLLYIVSKREEKIGEHIEGSISPTIK